MKTALVTGAHGFLGRNVAATLNQAGYQVHGVGIGPWSGESPADFGISRWEEAFVSCDGLKAMKCQPDVVVHCAGSGSVGFSLAKPYDDFCMTVDSTAAVIEYLRTSAPNARLIYPSSAAVYGCCHEGPLNEDVRPDPVSPYGVHKLMAEQLCLSANYNFDLDCRIIRFFSLYGPGLCKQLLWDASIRLSESGNKAVEFFGTGQETRDWLHVHDAATLILTMAEHNSPPKIVNGASGECCSVRDVLSALSKNLESCASIVFNGLVREGDPQHLQSDMSLAEGLGWCAEVTLAEGLKEYAGWFKKQTK